MQMLKKTNKTPIVLQNVINVVYILSTYNISWRFEANETHYVTSRQYFVNIRGSCKKCEPATLQVALE